MLASFACVHVYHPYVFLVAVAALPLLVMFLLLQKWCSCTMLDALKKFGSTACSVSSGKSAGRRIWIRRQMVVASSIFDVRFAGEDGGGTRTSSSLLLCMLEGFMFG